MFQNTKHPIRTPKIPRSTKGDVAIRQTYIECVLNRMCSKLNVFPLESVL
jgi:hypothetical protein